MANSVKHDILCVRCRSLFDDRSIFNYHSVRFQPYQSLNKCYVSAENGCHLCALLVSSLGQKDQQRLSQHPHLADSPSLACIYQYPVEDKPTCLRLRPTFCLLPHEIEEATQPRSLDAKMLSWVYAELEFCDIQGRSMCSTRKYLHRVC